MTRACPTLEYSVAVARLPLMLKNLQIHSQRLLSPRWAHIAFRSQGILPLMCNLCLTSLPATALIHAHPCQDDQGQSAADS